MNERREDLLSEEEPGTFVGTDRFCVLRRLGSGGTGTVYAARDRENECEVALKVLHDANPETLLLLKNEFRSVAELHHENLVRVRELVEDDGRWLVSMDLVDGVDVLSYVRPGDATALDEPRLRRVLPQIVLGLAALHRAGKVHCDVTPSNVLVTSSGGVKILDFGIIRDRGGAARDHRGLEGTPEYMSPEQVLGEDVGPSSDLYGVGAFVYTALTGGPPFTGRMQDILEAKVRKEPPAPASVTRGVPMDLDALCCDLLRSDPRARPTAEEVLVRLGAPPAASLAPPRDIFVGRNQELAALNGAFEDTRGAAPVTLVLTGESGIGKSYLAREFLRRTTQDDPDVLVLAGQCYEQESVPYKGLDGVIDALTRALCELGTEETAGLVPEDARFLRPLFPVVDRIAALAGAGMLPLDSNPYERRRKAVAALREIFVRVARRWRTIVRIEDVQWANADALQLLADILRPPFAPSLLVVLTRRPAAGDGDALTPGLDSLAGEVRRVEVGALSPEDASDLVERLLVGQLDSAVTSELMGAVARETRGHPLFIQELVIERGAQGSRGGDVSLDDALFARVSGLPEADRKIVEMVCLAGLPLSQELLAATQGVDFSTLTQSLPHLRAHRLVRGSGARRADTIEPYHDRIRESVVRHLDAPRRRALHRQLAVSLEAYGGAPAEVLAVHWQGAEEALRARYALVRAADGAAAAFAFDYAADLYRRALALGVDDVVLRQAITERLGDALRNSGRGRDAAAAYERAASWASGSRALDLRRRAAEQLMTSGQFDEGKAVFRRVLAEEGVRIAWTPLGSVVFGLLRRLWFAMRGLGFRERALADVEPALLRKMDVLWDVLRGLCLLDASLLFDLTVRLAMLALRAGEPTHVGRYLCVEAMSAAAAGDLRRGQHLVDVAAPLTERAGDSHTAGMHEMAQALVDFYANRWPLVVERAETTTAHFLRSHGGVAWETAVIQQFRLIAMFRAGQLRSLRVASRALFEDAERRGDQFGMTSYAVGHPTLVYLALDAPETGREAVANIMRRWTREAFLYQHYHAFLYEVLADVYSGDGAAAWSRVEEAWPKLRRACLLLFPEIAHEAWYVRARAALALAEQSPASSSARKRLVGIAREAARRLCARPLPWPRANGELVAAGVALLSGEAERARGHLTEAVRLCADETPMPLFAAAARRKLGMVIGGDEGRALEAGAEVVLRGEGVVRPERFAEMIVGG